MPLRDNYGKTATSVQNMWVDFHRMSQMYIHGGAEARNIMIRCSDDLNHANVHAWRCRGKNTMWCPNDDLTKCGMKDLNISLTTQVNMAQELCHPCTYKHSFLGDTWGPLPTSTRFLHHSFTDSFTVVLHESDISGRDIITGFHNMPLGRFKFIASRIILKYACVHYIEGSEVCMASPQEQWW